MTLDHLDRGKVDDETPEMRKRREKIVADSPTPHVFKMKGQMLAQGRTHEWLTEAPNMLANIKVYASGGENGRPRGWRTITISFKIARPWDGCGAGSEWCRGRRRQEIPCRCT